MKKFVYNMLCMVVLSLLASCTDERFDSIELKEVKAIVCDFDAELEDASRTSYEHGESGYQTKWADGDVLGVYPVGGDQVAFPLSKGTGGSEAVFDGGTWALKGGCAYAAYYPFSAANYTIPENRIPVTYAGQTQTGNDTFTHFASYDYLASKAAYPESHGSIHIKMKHLGSFFVLKLRMPKAGTYTKLALISDNQEFAVQGTLDLTMEEPAITPTSTSKTFLINLKDVALESDGELLTVNLMVAPTDLSESNITIKITDTEGNMYATASDQHITGKQYEANKIYTFTRTMVESEPEVPSAEQGHNTEPYFSEAVELLGLIWRLAGAGEYNQCQVSTVADSADKYFASMKNHYAVNLAKRYYQYGGIAYDAVTGYANQLIINELGLITFDPDYLEGSNTSFDRWNNQQKNDMLAAVNDFYEKSNFHDWFMSTQTEQQQAIDSFKKVCNLDYTWFDSFYGKNDKASSRIILSFMIGYSNNGISLKRKDGTLLATPVLGNLSQDSESVRFNGDLSTIIHEFSHPYCNPLIEANWLSIENRANVVYNEVSSIMASQAYGNAKIMMYETLVRASTIRYFMSHNLDHLVEDVISIEEMSGFMLVRTLVETLEKYEQASAKYAALADFMPEIVDAINQFDPNNPSGSDEPDIRPKDYVDLGIEMEDGKKLYFATRNVGEISPSGIASTVYRWGATESWGAAWTPETVNEDWPTGHKLDAAHDMATIQWGGDWHTPSEEEWNLLVEKCDYEVKEFDESGYGVPGYFFYNKSDRSKFIFLPFATWNEISYWTSEIDWGAARTLIADREYIGTGSTAGLNNQLAVRPVIAASGVFNANGHDYVDLGIQTNDGKKLYFATMNVGEKSPGGISAVYQWGATEKGGAAWMPESKNISWPADKKLDAAHDIATIAWGEKWHTPSVKEWNLLVEKCDYERKEANESGYDVAGYFFYNKKDHSKFIFLPVSLWSDGLEYWTSETGEPLNGSSAAYTFHSSNGKVSCTSTADVNSRGFAVRPVFVE